MRTRVRLFEKNIPSVNMYPMYTWLWTNQHSECSILYMPSNWMALLVNIPSCQRVSSAFDTTYLHLGSTYLICNPNRPFFFVLFLYMNKYETLWLNDNHSLFQPSSCTDSHGAGSTTNLPWSLSTQAWTWWPSCLLLSLPWRFLTITTLPKSQTCTVCTAGWAWQL